MRDFYPDLAENRDSDIGFRVGRVVYPLPTAQPKLCPVGFQTPT